METSRDNGEKFELNFELATIKDSMAWLTNYVDRYANSIDRFFTPESDVPEGKSLIKTTLSHQSSLHLAQQNQLTFKLIAHLPKTQKRWNLYIESFAGPDERSAQSSELSQLDAEQETLLGLSAIYRVSDVVGFKVRTGTRLSGGQLNPYSTAKLRFEWAINPAWFVTFEPELFWRHIEGTGKEGTLNLAYQYDDKHYLRATSNVFKYDELPAWQVAQVFEWRHNRDSNNRLSYRLGRLWDWTPEQNFSQLDTYLQFSWRNQFYDNWLFLSITPGVHAPLQLGYQTNPFVLVSFEAFSRKVAL
ncbi:MAG: hypothetical protein IBX48_01670 [Thiomicrospira sp.]|uniref:hypothetical protein n=1 Tax=Thiomicrospira sp. TaxID=935 RepID=UPI0019FE607F|nr:hypothetical protein [Thiomicrospira sp.]MBE0493026.1 hypothetical protein [Thiomicrospira sp.]